MCHQILSGFAVFVISAVVASSSAFGSVSLSNVPTGGNIAPFGIPQSETYGQVFTAPVTGTIDSFTMHLNGGVGALHGAVGTWNGPAAFGLGFGEAVNLYTSGTVLSVTAGSYTFTPGVNVVAGQRYVAYMSVFGEPSASASTSMPLGTSVPGMNYFVWNNATNPMNNPAWNYFFDAGNALFSATFTPSGAQTVPEPTMFAVFGGMFLLGGAAYRWKQCRA